MTGWQIALVFAVIVWIVLEVRGYWLRRERHRLLTDDGCRRWYVVMQSIRRSTESAHAVSPTVPKRRSTAPTDTPPWT